MVAQVYSMEGTRCGGFGSRRSHPLLLNGDDDNSVLDHTISMHPHLWERLDSNSCSLPLPSLPLSDFYLFVQSMLMYCLILLVLQWKFPSISSFVLHSHVSQLDH
jgi:hypothetical protein